MTDIDQPESLTQVPIAFGATEVHPVNAQMALLLNRSTGAQEVVSSDVANALVRCREFRTSRQHARVIAGPSAPEESITDIAGTLESLAAQGVLLRADTILEDVVAADPVAHTSTRIFIITADRPDAVERLLDSMLRAGGLTSFDAVFLVDDSKLADNRAANEALLSSFNTRSAKELYYFGAAQQQTLVKSLKSALGDFKGVHPVDFAIGDVHGEGVATYGRARNLCLLLSVGCKAVVLDDDILCQSFDFPEVVPMPRIDSSAVSSAYFEPNYEAATARIRPRAEPILSTVSRFVGVPAGTAIKELSQPLPSVESLMGCAGDVAANLYKDTKVLITQVGSVGDPGTEGAGWLTSLDESSQEVFVAALLDNPDEDLPRCCWRGVSAASFVSIGSMSQLTGLDNSELLPPYYPAFRGEDLLFAGLTKLVHPGSAALELPICVPHLPIDARPNISLSVEPKSGMTLGLAFAFVARQLDSPRAATPAETLARCAEVLGEWAARSDNDLEVLLRSLVADAQIDQMQRLIEALGARAALVDSAWGDYLKASHQQLQRTLQEPLAFAATEDEALSMSSFTLTQLRESAKAFAAVLGSWSDMRDAAVAAYADVLYSP